MDITSKDLSDMLLNIDDETKIKIIDQLPVAIHDAAFKTAETYIDDVKQNIDDDELDALKGIFILGYIACKAEQRISLDSLFIKED